MSETKITYGGRPLTREVFEALPVAEQLAVRDILNHVLFELSKGREGVYDPELAEHFIKRNTQC